MPYILPQSKLLKTRDIKNNEKGFENPRIKILIPQKIYPTQFL